MPNTEIIDQLSAKYTMSDGVEVWDIRSAYCACKTSPRFLFPNPDGDGSWCVPVSKGRVAIIDEKDVSLVMGRNWCYGESSVQCRESLNGKYSTVRLHRLIMGHSGPQKVDHINRNILDNRRLNLRLASSSQNSCNQGKTHKPRTSKYKGVNFNKDFQKWMCRCMVNGKSFYLGSFDSEADAAREYNKKSKEIHGEFACLNVISE